MRAESSKDHPFQLEVFGRVWLAWQHCWSPGVLIPALTHRFWKLSLQVLYIYTHSVHHMTYYTIMTLYIAPPPPPRYSCGQLYGLRDFVQSVQRFVISCLLIIVIVPSSPSLCVSGSRDIDGFPLNCVIVIAYIGWGC